MKSKKLHKKFTIDTPIADMIAEPMARIARESLKESEQLWDLFFKKVIKKNGKK